MKESTYTAADKAELDKIFEMRVVDYIILGIYSIVAIIVVAGIVFTVTMVFLCSSSGHIHIFIISFYGSSKKILHDKRDSGLASYRTKII